MYAQLLNAGRDRSDERLRVLLLEDSLADQELVLQALRTAGLRCDFECVVSRAGYEQALEHGEFDLILSDFTLPGYDGLTALSLAQAKCPQVPFLFVTGTIGEEKAVETIKQGATDFVLKKHLERLGFAVRRALQVMRERTLRLQAEERFRTLVEQSIVGIYVVQDDKFAYANPKMEEIFGASAEDLTSRFVYDFIVPEDRALARENVRKRISGEMQSIRYDLRMIHTSGAVRHVEVHGTRAEYNGRPAILGTMLDVTERKQMEEARIGERNLLRTLIDNLPSYIFVKDAARHYLISNRAHTRMVGVGAESEVIGKTVFDFFPQAIARLYDADDQTMLQTGQPVIGLEAPEESGGKRRWYSTTKVPLRDAQGKIVGLVGIKHDITERKQAEEALSAERQLLRTLIDNLPGYVYIKDTEGRYIIVNLPNAQLLGARDESGVNGKTVFDFFPPKIARLYDTDDKSVVQTGQPVIEREEPYEIGDKRGWFTTTKVPLRDGSGKIAGLVGITLDITERKHSEELLRDSEANRRAVWESSLDAIVTMDETGHIIDFNPAGEKMFGYRYADVIGQLLADKLIPPSMRDHHRRGLARFLATGQGPVIGKRIELQAMRADGTEFPVELIVVTVAGLSRPLFIGTIRNITERKRVEEGLRQSEARFAKSFNSNPAPMGLNTLKDGRIIMFNDRYCGLFGYTRDELIGRTIPELNLWADPAERAPLMERLLVQGFIRDYEARFRRKNGELRDTLLSLELIDFPGECEPVLISMFTDITERKRAEEAMRESEERFRQLAENIQEVFWMTDPAKNQMLYISPAYEKIWGRTCHSLYENPRLWVDAIHPEDRERILTAALTKQIQGDYDETYRIVRPDSSIRWIRDRAFPVRGAAGEILRVVGTAEDITERRQLEDQFRQAQKMEAIGQLAGGVAHDFNNILTVINGYADMLLNANHTTEESLEPLKQIYAAGERAANLTRQLLAFSRKGDLHQQTLDLNEVVGDVVKMLRRLIGENITLQINQSPSLPSTRADAGMLEQIILNLVVNARDAMPEGGQLAISTTAQTIDNTSAWRSSEARAGEFVCLSVRDTGCGIPPEILPRIFEPFFTTKETGKGTGLGLATVYGIVSRHQGWVEVESQVGAGTTFKVFLPVAPHADGADKPRATAPAVRGGQETILLVEDEAAVRALAVIILQRQGYRVLEAASGEEALDVWKRHSARIDLLLTDMIMPGDLTGRALAEQLWDVKPTLKVIFASGYSEEMAGQVFKVKDETPFLEKPYHPRKLTEMVRQALDRTGKETI